MIRMSTISRTIHAASSVPAPTHHAVSPRFTPSFQWVLGPCMFSALAAISLFAASTLAQSTPPETAPPVTPAETKPTPAPRPRGPILNSPRADAPTALEPIRPNLPGSPAAELGLTTNPPLIREGAFISNARGRMVKGKTGRFYFIFDRDATGRTFPPMVLLEGPNLASMERLTERSPEGSRLRIGGQVLAYHARNFLLVTVPPLLERPADPGIEPIAAPTPEPAISTQPSATSPSTTPPPAERSIEDIIADLDRAVGPSATAGARRPIVDSQIPAEARPHGATVEERSPTDSRALGYLASRRGRLVRGTDGWLEFRPDNGPSGKPEAAMTLLPSQNLSNLETLSDSAGENMTLSMSGDVFIYKGRSYLLPTMYVVNRDTGNLVPTQ